MTQEPTQKSEVIRKYQAKQTVVLSRVRELVGHSVDDGVNGSDLYLANSPNYGKLLPLHGGFTKGNPKNLTPTWNP
jgi:hypothetical protein